MKMMSVLHDAENFVNSFIESAELVHEYDPAKAREYYLRTRKLKGRKPGEKELPSSNKTSKAPPVKSTAQKAAEKKAAQEKLRKETEAKVSALKVRLAKLQKVLRELTAQAKARSGVDSKPSPKADTKSKPPTAAEKAKAAKAAKEYRDKHPQKDGDPSLSTQAKELEAKIKQVQERITKMKAQLAAAQKKATAKSKQKTARNGR